VRSSGLAEQSASDQGEQRFRHGAFGLVGVLEAVGHVGYSASDAEYLVASRAAAGAGDDLRVGRRDELDRAVRTDDISEVVQAAGYGFGSGVTR
jgi:hypothetical protein